MTRLVIRHIQITFKIQEENKMELDKELTDLPHMRFCDNQQKL